MTLDDFAPPHWSKLAKMTLVDASIIIRRLSAIYNQTCDMSSDKYVARYVAIHNARRYLVSLNV